MIKCSPFAALLGADPNIGLTLSSLPPEIITRLQTKDDMLAAMAPAIEVGKNDTTPADGELVAVESAETLVVTETEMYVARMTSTDESSACSETETVRHRGQMIQYQKI